ncbi:jg22627, partial [Pararge aegeria aegeria]
LTGCIVFYFILPETEGKKLNDIENHFAGVKNLTNTVYRSQKNMSIEISRMRDLKGTTNPTFEGDNTNL